MRQSKHHRANVTGTGRVPAAVLAAVWAGTLAAGALADTYSWGGATGNFGTAASWSGGVAPTALSATDTLVFGTANAYTATNNIYTAATRRQFYVSNLTLNDSSPTTIVGTGRSGTTNTILVYPPFRFVTAGVIDQLGAGTVQLAAPINIGPGGSLTVQAGAGSGQLTMANLTSPATLQSNNQFQGEGTLNFNNLSSNPILMGNGANFIGNINVLAGTVSVADSASTTTAGGPGTAGGDVISNQTLITVSPGATYNFNGNGETFGTVAGAGTIALAQGGGLTMEYDKSDVTFSGDLTQVPGGATPGGVNKDLGSGHTTYTWTGNAQHAGTTTVNAGTFVFSGNGRLSATGTVTLANAGALVLDNTATNVNGRLNPNAILNVGGPMTIRGAAGTATTESVATMNIGTIGGEGTLNVVNGAGGTTTLTVGTLNVTGTGGFVNFTGDGSVFVTNAPTLTNGILRQSTVNYADWATTDPGNGNKVVALSTYQTSPDPTAWTGTDNVRVTGALAGNADAATTTVNSLVLAAGTTANIGTSLSLAGGGILATGSASVTGGSINSTSPNNAFTAVVAPGATLTVNSNITDGTAANAVVKMGPGTLVLGGANTFTGVLAVSKGAVQVGSAAALGNGTISLLGGTLQFSGPVSTTKAVSLFGIESVIDTGTNNVSMTGTIGSGNAGNLTKKGSGTLTMALFSSSGDINIDEGTVVTGTGNTFGNGTKITVAAGAVLDLSFDTSGEDLGMIAGAGTIRMWNAGGIGLNLVADDVTFSGSIQTYLNGAPSTGTSGLDKTNVGSLTLSGNSTYTGTTRVQGGTIVITANALPATDGPLGNASSAVQLGFTPAAGSTEAELVSPAQFFVGAAGVTMGRDITAVGGTSGANGTATGMLTFGTKHTTGTSLFSGAISIARATELYTAGTSTASVTGVISGGGALSKTGGGTAVLTNTNTFTNGLFVQSGNLILASPGAGGTTTLNVSGGTLTVQPGLAAPLKQTGLNISSFGTMDLTDNDMIITYATSPIATVRALIARAYASGAWNGTGLTSSTAAAGGIQTLAAVDAPIVGITSFDGVAVGNAVLVKYTYFGDLNIDGRVDGDDYALADRAIAKGGLPGTAQWTDGDANYDGTVNAQDFLLIDKSAALWGGITLSPDFLAMREGQFGSEYVSALVASVPEPASVVGGVALAGMGLARRRRR